MNWVIHFFLVTTWIGLHALMLKRIHHFSPTVLGSSTVFSFFLKHSCLFKAPPPEYLVCTDWSSHTRLSQHRSPCLWSVFAASSLHLLYRECRQRLCKCVTWWQSVMSWSHRLKDRTTDEVFQALQEQNFVERSSCWCAIWALFTFKTIYMHKTVYNTLREREKKP